MAPLTTIASTTHQWSDLLQYIPFVGMALGRQQGNPFFVRIVEAIVIAIFAGYVSSQITLAVLENRISTIEKQVDKIYSDIYRPSLPSKP